MTRKLLPASTLRSPMLKTFLVLGDGWSFFILREAFFGVRRFDEFLKELGIPRSRLIERLNHLLDVGIFYRRQYSQHPPRSEYLLTKMGHDIYAMTLMMKRWGDRWRQAKPLPSLRLIHTLCGNVLVSNIACNSCRVTIEIDAVTVPEIARENEQPKFTVRRQLLRGAFEHDKRNDSVARTLAVIGDQWTMMIIREALLGTDKFSQFQQRLAIARGTLSSRLNHLVDKRVMQRLPYQHNPKRYKYQLTESGLDLYGTFLAMHEWAQSWLFKDSEQPFNFVHSSCGKQLRTSVVCEACQQIVNDKDVELSDTIV
jgi:DNA-binding HxlR family transcriptional regulator